MIWHKSQVPAWALGGNKPSGEVHGYPLHLLDSYFEAPVEGEPDIALLKAGRPAFNERVCMQPDPLPGLGATATDLDTYTRASVLLEGEQNPVLPGVGCEQYATPRAPQTLSFSSFVPLSLETAACDTAPGKGATLVPHAAPCLEVLKPPEWKEPPLEESGGVFSRPIHVAERVGAEPIERAVIDAYDPGGASSDANVAPAPTKDTASIEPASGAVKATTAKPEALELKGESMVWCVLETPPLPLPQKDSGKSRMSPREAPSMGTCRRGLKAPLPPP